jgi:PAS domain S-box-containing protein
LATFGFPETRQRHGIPRAWARADIAPTIEDFMATQSSSNETKATPTKPLPRAPLAEIPAMPSESVLRRFVEHVPVAAAMFDRQMRYLLVSRRWYADFDFLPPNLEGLCHYDVVPIAEQWGERHRRALTGEDMATVETSFVRPDNGKTEWITTQSLPWTRDDGEIGGILIFAERITAKKEAEVAEERRQALLRHQQKMEALGTLAGGIAHEINSPIQYISDNLAFLENAVSDIVRLIDAYRGALAECSPPPEIKRHVAEAERTADLAFLYAETGESVRQALTGIRSISRIVSAIKTFSHPGHFERSPVDINAVIRDAVVVSRNQWKHLATVEEDLDEPLPLVMGHGDQLGQSVLNLIVNSLQAIEDAGKTGKGRILLSSRSFADRVEIRVEDDGIGIPAHLIDKIYDPFFTTKAPGRGTGQGLSIAHAIVTRGHGGTIRCESEPGRFTRFTICLPLGSPVPEAGETSP